MLISLLKGIGADHTCVEYFSDGLLQAYNYTPKDSFWGQLGGALEVIDAGTTFVLDHGHGFCTEEHANRALLATSSSGISAIFACAPPLQLEKWDGHSIIPSSDPLPEPMMKHIKQLASQQPFGDGRVHIGFAFDKYFLPKEMILAAFWRVRQAGVKLITSHAGQSIASGKHSVRKLLKDYGLLQLPPLSSDILLSYCNRPSPEESSILSKYQIPIACTPETEVQGSMGWPAAFLPGLNATLGADCHFLNSSFMMHVARTALLRRRQETSLALHRDGLLPAKFRERSEAAFNAATIHGAKAVGHGNAIGSIQEGKLADLVVFNTSNPDIACAAGIDPLTAVVRFSEVRDIEMIIIDGVIRKRGGKLLPVMYNGQEFSWDEV